MTLQVSTGLLRDVGDCGDLGGGGMEELHESEGNIGNMGGGAWGLGKDSGGWACFTGLRGILGAGRAGSG